MRPINKSLIRHNLLFGGESELVGVLGIFCGVIIFADVTIINFMIAGGLWFSGIFLLQRLAKIDPMFFKIFQQFIGHQSYYSAKTPKWRKGKWMK